MVDMEKAAGEDCGDPPILIDSGTESINESPIGEDSSHHSSASTSQVDTDIWDIDDTIKQPHGVKNILDKAISVDEDSLIKPLEPTICCTSQNVSCDMNLLHLDKPLLSILRRTPANTDLHRRVSFPTDFGVLAIYKEPDLKTPYKLDETTSEKMITCYQESCKRHNAVELDTIKNQIIEIKNNTNFSAVLNLAGINLTMEVCETLEDLLKLSNFQTIKIKDCKFNDESIREFLNILEYYDSASEYITTDFYKETDTWNTFCSMLSKSSVLESLTLEGFLFNDNYIKMLLQNIKVNDTLITLKLSNCNIGFSPMSHLVDTIQVSKSITELYLPQTGLYTRETDLLGKLLSNYHDLKVLDISNNFIGDRGLEVLAKGLCNQDDDICGLNVFVIFNNQITEKSGPIISNIIEKCRTLHTLNIGYNNLTDAVVTAMESGLKKTTSLNWLGLQSTVLTDKGVMKLAELIQMNKSLTKVNLKGNRAIRNEGLEKLSHALTNTMISRVELDASSRNSDDPQGFMELVKKINAICTVNKSKAEQTCDEEVLNWTMQISRKVSLNCDPIYPSAPADSLHTMQKKSSASIPGSRFVVSKVTEKKPSRFVVVPVQHHDSNESLASSPPQDEEDNKFSNVRSSVSSNDSVESNSVYDSTTPSGESD